jgi:hypothetical protein
VREAILSRCWCDQPDEIEGAALHYAFNPGIAAGREIREYQPGHSSLRGVCQKALEAILQDGIDIAEDDDWNVQLGSADKLQASSKRHSLLERFEG